MIVHSGTQNRALDKRTARNNHPVCSRHMPVDLKGEDSMLAVSGRGDSSRPLLQTALNNNSGCGARTPRQ
jgi:hypothetical protein